MHPIVQWLEGLGLGQYGEAVAIDQSVLPDLAESDLEKLWAVLGHRKNLLLGIRCRISRVRVICRPVARTLTAGRA